MLNSQKFPFIQRTNELGSIARSPYLPLTLTYRNRSVEVVGLLDSGATVNVLPYSIGLELGAKWEEQTTSVTLTGNLAQFPATGLLVTGTVAQFAPVNLVFAWTKSTNIPLLLGRVNFFSEFDVCFYGYKQTFELRPRQDFAV